MLGFQMAPSIDLCLFWFLTLSCVTVKKHQFFYIYIFHFYNFCLKIPIVICHYRKLHTTLRKKSTKAYHEPFFYYEFFSEKKSKLWSDLWPSKTGQMHWYCRLLISHTRPTYVIFFMNFTQKKWHKKNKNNNN